MMNFQVQLFGENYSGTVEINENGVKNINSVRIEGQKMSRLQSAEFISAIVSDKIIYE